MQSQTSVLNFINHLVHTHCRVLDENFKKKLSCWNLLFIPGVTPSVYVKYSAYESCQNTGKKIKLS